MDVMVVLISNTIKMRETLSAARNKAFLSIIILLYLVVFLNLVHAKTSDHGLLVMEIHQPGFKPMEEFSVECFYYDNTNNTRKDDPWIVIVPNNAVLEVKLAENDRDLYEITNPPIRERINHPGPVKTWYVQPFDEGTTRLILVYYINGKSYTKPSDYINI